MRFFSLNRRFGFRHEVRGGVLLPEVESSPLQTTKWYENPNLPHADVRELLPEGKSSPLRVMRWFLDY